ncbi:MAG: UDP-N-acetylmuramate--L-alanine ligase [Propionibacteriaceae bacterium]|nr:UDP-N-acetylmuramate--L-alanine ligase [Propionibacteriaceae bacterium]
MTLLQPQPIPALADLGRVHFIAVGGAGMSGVASAYLAKGLHVSGCDQSDSEAMAELARQGAEVWIGHDPHHLATADSVVVSTAIRADNPEVVEAHRLGLPVLHRSVALSALMEGYEVVSVAGTHGKTTTTAMCVAGLQAAGEDPSYVVGGTLVGTQTGSHIGLGPRFLVEADESDGSFRQYPTRIVVITSVDVDHLDNWGDPRSYAQGFDDFASAESVALVIVDADNPGARSLGQSLVTRGRPVMTYGQSETSDVRLTDIVLDGGTSQAVVTYQDWSATLTINLPGLHNLHNACAALCLGLAIGADSHGFLTGLAGFRGTARRFQRLGQSHQILVVDDYAHHPTEVAATVDAARLVAGKGRVIICFQPHLFSRTLQFADAFGAVLAGADEVVVVDIYPAREDPIPGVTGALVAQAVAAHSGHVTYVPLLDDAVDAVVGLARPGDVVLTVGAGSVTNLGPQILASLEAREPKAGTAVLEPPVPADQED